MNHPPTKGLRHLALKVRDIKKMRAFYELLGFEIEWEPDAENVYLTSGLDNLALHETTEPIASGSLDHLGIIVPAPQDVDSWADYLKEKQIELKQQPKTHRDGARSIYLADPEGNVIQIIYHPPISGKG